MVLAIKYLYPQNMPTLWENAELSSSSVENLISNWNYYVEKITEERSGERKYVCFLLYAKKRKKTNPLLESKRTREQVCNY